MSPQSTGSTTPVIAAAASEARNADARIDLDRLDDAAERIPARQLLKNLRIARRCAASQIGVRTVPGQTMLTRMP